MRATNSCDTQHNSFFAKWPQLFLPQNQASDKETGQEVKNGENLKPTELAGQEEVPRYPQSAGVEVFLPPRRIRARNARIARDAIPSPRNSRNASVVSPNYSQNTLEVSPIHFPVLSPVGARDGVVVSTKVSRSISLPEPQKTQASRNELLGDHERAVIVRTSSLDETHTMSGILLDSNDESHDGSGIQRLVTLVRDGVEVANEKGPKLAGFFGVTKVGIGVATLAGGHVFAGAGLLLYGACTLIAAHAWNESRNFDDEGGIEDVAPSPDALSESEEMRMPMLTPPATVTPVVVPIAFWGD